MATLIDTRNVGPFSVRTYAMWEHMHLSDCFDYDEDELLDLANKINDGSLEWFMARVEVRLDGIELGEAYLSGCLYDSFEDFATGNDYHGDMIQEAIDDAKLNLTRLVELSQTLAA